MFPKTGSKYRKKDVTKIEFFIDDELSGIAGTDNISVKIDDIPVLFEFNSYRKEVKYNFEEWLTIGEHSLDIEITDNVGNTTKRKGKFIVK